MKILNINLFIACVMSTDAPLGVVFTMCSIVIQVVLF